MKLFKIFIGALFLLFTFSSCKYLESYEFSVLVVDEYGNFPVSGVTVQVYDRSGNLLVDAVTDNSGKAYFTDASYGKYIISVDGDGYRSAEEEIKITEDNQLVTITITPFSLPSGGIINARVLDYSSNHATFELTFFFADSAGRLVTDLTSSDIEIEDDYFSSGNYYDFTLIDLEKDYFYGNGYSVAVTIDQSGSISSTDPSDSRIIGAKIFFSNLQSNYGHLLAFASGGQLPYDITSWGDYTTDGTRFFDILDLLKDMEDGGTPLYKAAYAATDDVYYDGPMGYKYVLLFTDGEDTDGGYTIDDVVNNANDKGVVIHTVGLGSGTNLQVLAQLAYGTGGFLINSSNPYQLVSGFRALSNLMAAGGTIYRATWDVYVDNDVFPGWFETQIIIDWGSQIIIIPFHVDVPSSKLAIKGETKETRAVVSD